jgi:integrase/recombinase XerD
MNGRGGPLSYDAAQLVVEILHHRRRRDRHLPAPPRPHATELINSGVSPRGRAPPRPCHASAETTKVYALLADKVAGAEIRAARRKRKTRRR